MHKTQRGVPVLGLLARQTAAPEQSVELLVACHADSWQLPVGLVPPWTSQPFSPVNTARAVSHACMHPS